MSLMGYLMWIESDCEIDYCLGRMHQSFSEIEGLPYEHRIFKGLKEAKDWLRV